MAKCPVCNKDKYSDGKPLEINGCAYCGRPMCFSCWCKHTDICEIKKEHFKKGEK
jgi:hypothetical protein